MPGLPRLHSGIIHVSESWHCALADAMWEIESRFSQDYLAIASSSSCQLSHNFLDPAQDSLLSGRKFFETMDVMNPPRWLRFRRFPKTRKASTCRLLCLSVLMDIKLARPSFSIVSLQRIADFLSLIQSSFQFTRLICSAISQWLFAHSPYSSLSYLPRNPLPPLNPLLPLNLLLPLMPSTFMEPAHHPTALPRR
jgi:hypothetical protein